MKDIFCRVKEYKLSVLKNENTMIRVGSANYEACKALNMDIVERGIYEKWISVDDADCIWREESYGFRGGEYFSGEIEVIKGTVKVKAEDVTKSFDKFDTKFCKRGSFAIYNGGVYRSYDGVNNNVLYHLASYDIESQDQGFILDSPGRFSKMVSANEVSFSYESHTWCEYCGKKFSITEGEGDIVLLEPYSRDDYSTMELGSLGFCLFKTRWVKKVSADDLSSIWVIEKPHNRFTARESGMRVIKGSGLC